VSACYDPHDDLLRSVLLLSYDLLQLLRAIA
jgi:hypothetical protein